MVACYIMATWFLDAFKVIGFMWPNGERGSGKTQLLSLIAELGYLGQLILAGGSFASLRDMADYGATLCFDDAENLSDPKRTDPDKRTLLLAGNRRGNTVPVKEPAPDRTWRTRYVNTFCARAFSAIRLPDQVLASRTIIVPLIRTPDRHRANADPLEYSLWPHDRRMLIDSLWSLALGHLAELPKYESQINERATLTGRNLEPWRALLAVAAWIEDAGVIGLYARMEKLSVDYQSERGEMESADPTILVIRALCRCAINAINANSAIKVETKWVFTTEQIKDAVVATANDSEADVDVEKLTSKRVGRTLGKMRLSQAPRPGGRGSRRWVITIEDLQRWTSSYGINLATYVAQDGSNLADLYSTNGTNGTDGTNGTSHADEIAEHEAVLNYYAGNEPEPKPDDAFEYAPGKFF
jgi:hypothetical protein